MTSYLVQFRSYRSLLFKFWTLCVGGLATTYNVHIGLIGKRVVDFLLVLIELFTALHGMQTRSSDENSVPLSVCPSVRLSVRQTRGL